MGLFPSVMRANCDLKKYKGKQARMYTRGDTLIVAIEPNVTITTTMEEPVTHNLSGTLRDIQLTTDTYRVPGWIYGSTLKSAYVLKVCFWFEPEKIIGSKYGFTMTESNANTSNDASTPYDENSLVISHIGGGVDGEQIDGVFTATNDNINSTALSIAKAVDNMVIEDTIDNESMYNDDLGEKFT